MENHQNATIQVDKFVFGGDVLGRLPDGRAAFVPFAIPGETVRITIKEQKKGFVRVGLEEVIIPSDRRVAPRCSHFGVCGGCQYQHISYHDQLATKQEILIDQFERIGKVENPPVRKIVSAPEPFYYRNHIQFHLDDAGLPGFLRAGSDLVLAIDECHLPETFLNQIWSHLDFEAFPEIERVGIRSGSDGQVQLILHSNALETPAVSVEDIPISVVHVSPGGTLVLAGSESLTFEVLGHLFRVSAGSFFQTNTIMAKRMVKHILDTLPAFQPLNSETVAVDAYCGVGLFTAFLAERCGKIIGIESSSSACDDFVVNLDEFDHVSLYESSAEIGLASLDLEVDIILIDPPRAGLSKKALDALVKLSPGVIVYVSCDPATLARDSRRLIRNGYRLAQVTPFDLFPQTYHIESISFFARS